MPKLNSLASSIKSSIKIKTKFVKIDNIFFRLHYGLTCWFLLAFTAIICVEEYNKDKIKCTHSDPTDSRKRLEHVVNTFCFFMTTFTIPRHFNGTSEGMVAPGIGPARENELQVRHGYYQWVPYVLFFQAICFYVPHYIWKKKENKQLEQMVSSFDMMEMLDSDNRNTTHNKVYNFMNDRMRLYKNWVLWLIFCEALNLVNVVLQFILTDMFLGGKFHDLGTLVYTHYGSNEYNPLDNIFPKTSKCTFFNYGTSGTLQTHDLICVLSLNILNEKIYLVLWYWYIILFSVTVLALLHRFLSYFLYKTEINYNLNLFLPTLPLTKKKGKVSDLLENLSYGQWFFLTNLASNLDPIMAGELVEALADKKDTFVRHSKRKTIEFERRSKEEEQPLVDNRSENGGSSPDSSESSKSSLITGQDIP